MEDHGVSEFFASDAAGKSNVSWEKGNSSGVIGTKISIFKKTNDSGFSGLLKG